MNAANLSAYQLSGMVDGKEWLATQDSTTRDSHRALDGTQVPITGMFHSETGNSASAPGLFGVAEEDINCRCTCLPVLSEKSRALEGVERFAVWKLFDDRVESESKSLLEAFRSAFSAQEKAVRAALDHAA
jgi:hypothetical protein